MNPGGPGWNDPPTLSYQTHTQTTSRRNILNKRIGLQDLKIPEKPTNAILTGPPPLSKDIPPANRPTKPNTAPIGPSNSLSEKCTGSVKIFNPLEPAESPEKKIKNDVKQEETELPEIEIVTELKLIVQKCNKSEIFSKQVSTMIDKKLDIISTQLKDGKLPVAVKQKMMKLTHFIMIGKYDKAWEVHVELVCDYSSSVMQWMVGVKRLITEAKKLEQQ